MEGVEELKAWIRSFSKKEGRKPQAADMPADIRCIYTAWKSQRAGPPQLAAKQQRVLEAPSRQEAVNPFARPAKKAKMDLPPKGLENKPPPEKLPWGPEASPSGADLTHDEEPASLRSPSLALRTSRNLQQVSSSLCRLPALPTTQASTADGRSRERAQEESCSKAASEQHCRSDLPPACGSETRWGPMHQGGGVGPAAAQASPAAQEGEEDVGAPHPPAAREGRDFPSAASGATLPAGPSIASQGFGSLEALLGGGGGQTGGVGLGEACLENEATERKAAEQGGMEPDGEDTRGTRGPKEAAGRRRYGVMPPELAAAASRPSLQAPPKQKAKARQRRQILDESTAEDSDSQDEAMPASRKPARKPRTRASDAQAPPDSSECDEGGDKPQRPAPRKKAAAGPRAPGQRVAASKQGVGRGGGAAGAGVAKKPRQNFVRMDKKGGSGRFGYKSKAGMKRGKGGQGKGRKFAPKFLPQAGEGADIVEGWEAKRGRCCFKCGKPGHFANACPGLAGAAEQVVVDEEPARQGPPLQGDALAQRAVQSEPAAPGVAPSEEAVAEPISEEVQAAIQVARSGGSDAEEGLMQVLRGVFKHQQFRGQQAGIIQKVLQGQSTLAILPTGAGKSLCYQVPALVQEGTTLVVSPLVALMRDQLSHLPPELPAAMLWRGQTKAQAMQVLQDLKEGRLRVLYVAPERLHNETLLNALAPLLPLPLLVVDEAHCVAEWGHNFRSAYFRLGHLIQERVPCKTVLALTATATKTTQHSIREVLGIPQESTVREAELPPNLRLAVQDVKAGLQGSLKPALLKIVKQAGEGTTTIVYTTFQSQADEIAGYLYVNGVAATSYHAGKMDQERERIQEEFCQARLRVVVATVAFGMGLDAMHVRCVVHLSMPRSLEEYVQQVGRAGRSGEEGRCHMFLSNPDYLRLRSLSHSDGVDSCQVAVLLEEVFCGDHTARSLRKNRASSGLQPGGRFGVLSIPQLVQRLDIKEEVLETLLSYVEALDGYLKMLPPTSATVSVAFYADDPQRLAAQHEVVRCLLTVVPKPRQGSYHAPMAALCNLMLQPPYRVVRALQDLAAADQLRFELARQQALAFEVLERPSDLHAMAEDLAARHGRASRLQVARIDTAFRTFDAVRKLESGQLQEAALRSSIREYFEGEAAASEGNDAGVAEELQGLPLKPAEPMLGADCRALLLQIGKSGKVAANPSRIAARILHGLSSPEYPAKAWSNCGFWGRYSDVAFSTVLRIAQRQSGI